MSWATTTASSDQKFEKPPIGPHPAILVAIIDLGHQEEEDFEEKGKFRDVHKIYLVWELTACPMTGTTNNHLMGRQYTMSLNENAALRKMIAAWRGRDLAEGEEFDPLKMLGTKCMLSLSRNKKDYPVLDNVSAVHSAIPVPPAKRPLTSRAIAETTPIPDWLPYLFGESIESKISRAKEMRRADVAKAVEPRKAVASGGGVAYEGAQPVKLDESDIPFSFAPLLPLLPFLGTLGGLLA